MFKHETVLREEAVAGLNIRPNGVIVDCTLGGSGHSQRIVEHLGAAGTLIGIDQDDRALAVAEERLASAACHVHLLKSNFVHLRSLVESLDISQVDGVLFDLGVSSPQLDEGERGFSYHQEARLDMRMDQGQSLSAYEVVNQWSEEELSRIIYRYGEEKFARRIANRIIEARLVSPIETTSQLVEVIKEGIPAAARRTGPHPARRTFQAIRIAVNDELGVFESALEQAIQILAPKGRVSVITFHSLEDRLCKRTFQEYAQGCICPPDFPICSCNQVPTLKIINKKPILASGTELESNARARSAKLRIAEKE
ncbi:16S rRNA (cytosine(1402)-N(4))-methyltransferase RsmH [Mechercharimyces sp. CAU 1602]|uniref:16S rRNA (cytosine(1402)-N(4))-methyltransferase RsmH n=1 Tax=Mechercharimyces sp. CAU 1602 TaxID=2973933 RepID=UPI00216300B4|nr:16S rRNA (cytosine(1402)-N(4))-methyltransferase RsmH [Mechercharimyces sp. CAU 1602]MCS1350616.1 16S rRNA (cytosine(1402)-N(4))-methyltransferase RsmH [Mechercharimyces sp. CAU 1602]